MPLVAMNSVVSAIALLAVLQSLDAPAVARAASEEFAQGRFTEFMARFDAQMKAAATEPMLRQVLDQITMQAGAFEKAGGETTCANAAGMRACVTPLLFERAEIGLRIVVNADSQVAGLFIASSKPRNGAAPAAPPAAAPPHSNIDVVPADSA